MFGVSILFQLVMQKVDQLLFSCLPGLFCSSKMIVCIIYINLSAKPLFGNFQFLFASIKKTNSVPNCSYFWGNKITLTHTRRGNKRFSFAQGWKMRKSSLAQGWKIKEFSIAQVEK